MHHVSLSKLASGLHSQHAVMDDKAARDQVKMPNIEGLNVLKQILLIIMLHNLFGCQRCGPCFGHQNHWLCRLILTDSNLIFHQKATQHLPGPWKAGMAVRLSLHPCGANTQLEHLY